MNVLHGVGKYICLENDYGLTKGYIGGSLMRYGLPWHAGCPGCQRDNVIQNLKRDCDEQLQLFVKDPTTFIELASELENPYRPK